MKDKPVRKAKPRMEDDFNVEEFGFWRGNAKRKRGDDDNY